MTQIASSSVIKPVLLDAGPLGALAHPRPNQDIANWLESLLLAGVTVIVPAIADFEVRRNMLAEGMTKSLARLEFLKANLIYLPLRVKPNKRHFCFIGFSAKREFSRI